MTFLENLKEKHKLGKVVAIENMGVGAGNCIVRNETIWNFFESENKRVAETMRADVIGTHRRHRDFFAS